MPRSRTLRPRLHWLALAAASATLAAGPALAQSARPYPTVTDARLANPEPANWLQYRGNYGGWGYSPLKQINNANVAKLQLAWAFSTGQVEGHQSPPMVNGGYMYITTPGSQIVALDAKTGTELWRYKKQLPAELTQLHPTNRGVALYGDKLYFATLDCMLVALDAKTGKVLWEKPVENWKTGYYMTLAPLAAKGKIMVGSSGGEFGVRGFVAAYDAETGAQAWRTYTVPAPGEPGGDTWPDNGSYKTGGGSIWITGTYDPARNVAYWGTGNPAPWTPDTRQGDNLYTSSSVALDVDTGKITGHHQYTWNDSWDWDEVSPPILFDTEFKGRKIQAAVRAGRNGYMWVLERDGGKLKFVDAWPYVNNNVFTGLDKTSGRPSYDMSRKPALGKGADYCPSLWGGKDWTPEAYNPGTGLFYVPANNNLCSYLPGGIAEKYKPGELWIGFPLEGILSNVRVPKPDQSIGEIQAWDMKTGKLAWSTKFNTFLWAPLMTTGGNLVFAGGTNDRMFRAFDARNGKTLWETATPSGVTGVPSTYEVDGEQYVAVLSGWGVDAERMQGAFNSLFKTTTTVPQGGNLMVYKLPK
ncbi:PQQ-dependent dehydrogenase, methanol/ethanol family [Aquabacterium sp. OR-4]|uniref:PQQ-dependent dehydrogenase, methanol/ethanol family n=1 Tax=Aquabacterium sp. OR-4 TaxID=2978127 RepID=UPI0021B2D48B|nr:PQQ-dependent dehydrogenase, methanol/ethanol family [Aquabacterium sp. OR-4]MDT7838646.1 PQQ-dependent dehydrogenase, methanol/ethanol family [Aquabacterium sp. OR-4]